MKFTFGITTTTQPQRMDNSTANYVRNIIESIRRNNIPKDNYEIIIVGGEDNLITGGTHNIIGGGEHNVIKPRFTYNTIVSGVTADSTTHSIIGAGKDNLIVGADNSSIVSGSLNIITGGTHNHIGSGVNNTLDKTTTTPDLVDRNILYAKVFVKPARSIEFIVVDFIITRSGVEF